MNSLAMEREKEIEMVKKKLAAMENLNRALGKERNELIQVLELFKTGDSHRLYLHRKLAQKLTQKARKWPQNLRRKCPRNARQN
jgi:hypothetical protein